MLKYKLYLFDLDGVLVNTNDLQYITIKQAIKDIVNYDISTNKEIDNIFKSTITSLDKLKYLNKKKIINSESIQKIYEKKKEIANEYFYKLDIDKTKQKLFKYLKENNCKIGVVTNSNKKSAEIILNQIGIRNYIDVLITNNEVNNPKPSPEPYLKAINSTKNINIEDIIIFEDSEIGIESAINTGCYYYKVNDIDDVNIDLINKLNN
jgi:HAD superfamily hydrolase (TIGR01509 family)